MKYIYGHCTQSRQKHNYKYISEQTITEQVITILKSIQIPEYAYRQVSEVLRLAHEDKKRTRTQLLSSMEGEILKC